MDKLLLNEEEQKRERNWDPLVRWQVLQQTIAWVDSQQEVPRNSRTACLRLQAEKLAQLRKAQIDGSQ